MIQLYNCAEACTNGKTTRCCNSCDIKGSDSCHDICGRDVLKCGMSKPFMQLPDPPEDPFKADMFVKLTALRNTVWMEDIPSPANCREYQEHHASIKLILAELDLIIAEVIKK